MNLCCFGNGLGTNILLNYCDTKNATNFAPSLPIGVSQKQLFCCARNMHATHRKWDMCWVCALRNCLMDWFFIFYFQKQGVLFAAKDICPIVSRPLQTLHHYNLDSIYCAANCSRVLKRIPFRNVDGANVPKNPSPFQKASWFDCLNWEQIPSTNSGRTGTKFRLHGYMMLIRCPTEKHIYTIPLTLPSWLVFR